MFVKAIGGKVSAFRIKGDPNHFSAELLAKSVEFDFNVILFPWRPSIFAESLLWSSLDLVASPVALLVQCNHAHAHSSTSNHEPLSPCASEDGSTDDANRTRARTLSVSGIETVLPSPEASVSDVLVVITGAPCDVLLLPLALRAASNPNLQVTVSICAAADEQGSAFSDSLVGAIESFRSRVRAMRHLNVILETSEIAGNAAGALMAKLTQGPRFDLVVVSFAIAPEPEEAAASEPPQGPSTSPTVDGLVNRPRKLSLGESASDAAPSAQDSPFGALGSGMRQLRANTIFGAVPITESERRAQIGVPSRLADCPLAHPELGSLGSALHKAQLAPYLLVYHEPNGGAGLGVGATPFDLSLSAVQARGGALGTILEEEHPQQREADEEFGQLKRGTDSDSER